MSDIRQFGSNDPLWFAAEIVDRDTRVGIVGLTNVRIRLVYPGGSDATPVSPKDLFTEWNATIIPGRYRITINQGDLLAGRPAGVYSRAILPNSAQAMEITPEDFEILAAVPTTIPPTYGPVTPGTLEELLARRNSLILRRESLVTRVSAGDKSVEYDLDLVGQALEELNRQIAVLNAGGKPIRQIRMVTDKGL